MVKKDDFIGMAIAGIIGAVGIFLGINFFKNNNDDTAKKSDCGCGL